MTRFCGSRIFRFCGEFGERLRRIVYLLCLLGRFSVHRAGALSPAAVKQISKCSENCFSLYVPSSHPTSAVQVLISAEQDHRSPRSPDHYLTTDIQKIRGTCWPPSPRAFHRPLQLSVSQPKIARLLPFKTLCHSSPTRKAADSVPAGRTKTALGNNFPRAGFHFAKL